MSPDEHLLINVIIRYCFDNAPTHDGGPVRKKRERTHVSDHGCDADDEGSKDQKEVDSEP